MIHKESSFPQIVLVTGAMAAGKSSVAQALAERLPNSVHVRGDVFRRMIINGRAIMTAELSTEASRQLELRYLLAAEVAQRYADAGFTVIYQDIVLGASLDVQIARFAAYKLGVVVLCPRAEVLATREQARAKKGYSDTAMIQEFDRIVRDETPRHGLWLDTSDLTLEATVDAILAHYTTA